MTATMTERTGTILDEHLAAVAARSLEVVLGHYTEDSVLFTQDGPIRGLAGLRAFFAAFIGGLTDEVLGNFRLLRRDVDGETAYIVWAAAPLASLGTDTFVVRDGVIVAQSLAILAAG